MPDEPQPPLSSTEEDRAELDAAKAQLRTLIREFRTADPKQAPRLTREIQRMRIAVRLLEELVTGDFSEDTYREMSLMNRMITGNEAGEDTAAETAAQEAARETLTAAGINPDSASRIARALQTVLESGHLVSEPAPPEPDDAPDPADTE